MSGWFKTPAGAADELPVEDGAADHPFVTRDPVDDTGRGSTGGFRFDLGSALAQLGPERADAPSVETESEAHGGTDDATIGSVASSTTTVPGPWSSPVQPPEHSDGGSLPVGAGVQPAPPADQPAPGSERPGAGGMPPWGGSVGGRAGDPGSPEAAGLPVRGGSAEVSSAAPARRDVEELPVRRPSAPVDLPVRGTGGGEAAPLPVRRPPAAAPSELPMRQPNHTDPLTTAVPGPTPRDEERPVATQQSAMSVFDATSATGGSMSASGVRLPGTPPRAPMAPSALTPRLPESTAASSRMMAPPPTEGVASVTDVRELRRAQIRASRNRRQGKVLGRSLAAALLIGALLAAALLFGRPYLFPVEWDARVVGIVDEIQIERDGEFVEAVPLIEQTPEQFGATVASVVFGPGWADRLPEWRALGLASGAATVEAINARVATVRAAVYDPATRSIYMVADAEVGAIGNELRLALEQAYADQVVAAVAGRTEAAAPVAAVGFAGLIAAEDLAGAAIDQALVESVDDVGDTPAAVAGESPETTMLEAPPVVDAALAAVSTPLPIPLAYQLAVIDELGADLLAAAALEPSTARIGDEHPDVVVELLADDPIETAEPSVRAGDQPLLGPVALGADDWSLVWSARLPADASNDLTTMIRADSYRVVSRSGSVCAIAVFQSAAQDAGGLAAALQEWAAGGTAAGTSVSRVGPRLVQIDACDPGESAATPDDSGVSRLVEAQQARLGAG